MQRVRLPAVQIQAFIDGLRPALQIYVLERQVNATHSLDDCIQFATSGELLEGMKRKQSLSEIASGMAIILNTESSSGAGTTKTAGRARVGTHKPEEYVPEEYFYPEPPRIEEELEYIRDEVLGYGTLMLYK